MIKYIQKLKAKKGFTLVELIVVIAIIGVLAAILIPVMLGYVTDSRVTSADSTASTLKDAFNTFITAKDKLDASIKRTTTAEEFTLTNATNGSTDATTSTAKFTFKFYDTTSATSILSKKAQSTDSGAAWLADFAKQIENDYNFDKVTAKFVVLNGQCIGVSYYAGTGTDVLKALPGKADFTKAEPDFKWSEKPGVVSDTSSALDGEIIGTNPKINKIATT